MEFEWVRIPVPIPRALIDLLVVPVGALWIAAGLVYDYFCRDEHGQLH